MAKTSNFTYIHDALIHARDGEVVVYMRENSKRWQARYKLADARWQRISTKQTNPEYAVRAACEAYDRARFLKDENLPISSKRFDAVANLAIKQMQDEIDAGSGKSVYQSYISAINLYLIPFFGKHNVNNIDYSVIKKFETWRQGIMKKAPKASTITTHNSALNRVFEVALERGWISNIHIPKLTNKGEKSTARPAFSHAEYMQLTRFMPQWIKKGRTEKSTQMRELLRDYVLILANTGMRHGTEALRIKWKDLQLIKKKEDTYLQISVNGKTGPRELIAEHDAIDYFKRIQSRFAELAAMDFEKLLKARLDEYVFRLKNRRRTPSLNGTFAILMCDSGLAIEPTTGQNRTLYSLRHTYATKMLVHKKMDIHTLAKQMGTSVAMIEAHYSKLTPLMKAEQIAGKSSARYEAEKQQKTEDNG